ncbi:MAG: hypothetical protein L0H53_09305 [Candidatus Nitrosocosmicus sp.]|nr:hypothetical protein [Candidatus Nitrosocosmicus sp.]MDN5867977.1 hypothetical protein [Candidatus Nitrosocosmicus sp.]
MVINEHEMVNARKVSNPDFDHSNELHVAKIDPIRVDGAIYSITNFQFRRKRIKLATR